MDVNRRIQKAGNDFGMMRKCLFSSPVVKLKTNVYRTFILRIPLYGVDNENLLNRLRRFHRCCVRSICHVTLRNRLRIFYLLHRLSLESIDIYVCVPATTTLGGHVIRMPWSRLPRKMLSCWVRSKRLRGAPKYT